MYTNKIANRIQFSMPNGIASLFADCSEDELQVTETSFGYVVDGPGYDFYIMYVDADPHYSWQVSLAVSNDKLYTLSGTVNDRRSNPLSLTFAINEAIYLLTIQAHFAEPYNIEYKPGGARNQ